MTLALLHIKEALKQIPPQTLNLASRHFPAVRVCDTTQRKSRRRPPRVNSPTFFHLLRRRREETRERCERGRIGSLLIFASYTVPATSKSALLSTSSVVGCGTPHSSPPAQRRKSLITVIVCCWGYLAQVIWTVRKYIQVKKGFFHYSCMQNNRSASSTPTLSVAALRC